MGAMAQYKETDSYKEFQAAKKAKKAKKKAGKRPKDKNAPKRPLSAFFIFANEIRDAVKAENPEASIGQIGKILGQKWAELSEEEKTLYKKQNEKAKEQYAL